MLTLLLLLLLLKTGAQRGERHRGAEGVRARDGESVPDRQEECADGQGPDDRPRRRGGGLRYETPPWRWLNSPWR